LHREKGREEYVGPGHWNDPDMLLIGNHGTGKATSAKGRYKGLTQDEYRTHFGMWCMLDAPLLASCDLRNISKEDFDILTDVGMLEIDQDYPGQQAEFIKKKNGFWFYKKKLSYGNYAVAVINMSSRAKNYTINDKDFGMKEAKEYSAFSLDKPLQGPVTGENKIASHATAIYIVNYK
jgi:alpha-galactosidase